MVRHVIPKTHDDEVLKALADLQPAYAGERPELQTADVVARAPDRGR